MKKMVSLLLVFVMVFSLTIPSAWAAGGGKDSPVADGTYESGTWKQGGNGYVHYGNDEGLDLDLSKTAKPVKGSDTEFDVTLEITTRQTKTETPPGSAATVLVFDRSDSMKDGIDNTTRLAAAKKAAIDFINGTGGKPGYKGDTPGTGRYLALVVFAREAEPATKQLSGWVDVSIPSEAAKVVSAINGLSTKGQTNHDDGLRKASDLLDADIVASIAKEQKNVIMLTDGKPTYSASFSKSNGEKMIEETAQTAAALRQKAQIYTICFAAQNEKCYRNSSLTVGEFLRTKIATPATASQKYAYNADNVSELNAAFAAITESVVSGLTGSGWVVTDPMGKGVKLENVSQCTGTTSTTGSTLRWTISNPEKLVDGGMTIFVYTLTYRVSVDNTAEGFNDEVYHPLNKETYVTIAGQKYAFPVPGAKVPAPRYTVTYQAEEGGSLQGADSSGKVIHSHVKKWSKTPAAPEVVCEEGYYFTGWTPAIQEKVTGNATYTAQFAEKQTLTVQAKSGQFIYDGQSHTVSGLKKTSFTIDGQTYTVEGLSAAGSTTFGTAAVTVTGTPRVVHKGVDVTERFTVLTENGQVEVKARPVTLTSKDASKTYDGTPLQNTEIEVGGQGLVEGESFVYSDFASRTDVGSTKNTFSFAAGPNTDLKHYAVTQSYGELTVGKNTNSIVIEANSKTKTYDGTPLTESGFTCTPGILVEGDELSVTVEGTITDAGTAVNKVTGYQVMRGNKDVTDYYTFGKPVDGVLTVKPRAVTMTSADGSKTYDGTPLTAENVEAAGFVKGEGAAYHDFASLTEAGEKDNTFEYTLNENTKAGNYEITKISGKLVVTPVEAQLTITAASDKKTYDGTPLTDNGYQVSDGVLAKGDRVIATVEGSATHVGDEGANKVTQYQIMRGGVDVTDNYSKVLLLDGKLTITPRPVSLVSDSAKRIYNGQPLTAENVEAEGFVKGEGATYSGFASRTDVGSSDNTFQYALNEGTLAADYAITKQCGTLTVTPVTAELVITAASDDKMYDGTPLTNDGFTCTPGVLVKGDELTATVEGSATHVGDKGVNTVTGWKILRGGEDVTANYTGITTRTGALTITKRDVTLTSATDSKVYNGQPLTAEVVTVTGSGFAADEGAVYSDFASRTDVGSEANTFQYSLREGTRSGDYTISVVNGTLTVTANENEIVIMADNNSKIYDGTPLTDSGYSFNEQVLAKGDELTAVVEGTITDAGTAENVVKSYQILRGDVDITANYGKIRTVNGTLTVDKRPVTMTSADAKRVYNGQPLTAETVEAVGFVKGEGASYSDFASITDVGEKANTYQYALNEGTKAGNYTITVQTGTLTVTPREQELKVTADSASKVYDGTPLTKETVHFTPGVLADGDQLTAVVEGTATHVGDEGTNKVVSVRILRGDVDVTANYTGIVTEDGQLTITQRPVLLKSGSRTEIYNGKPVTAETVTVEGAGFVEGEGAAYSNFASLTDVGEKANTFDYALTDSTRSTDYAIQVENGTLRVTPVTGKLTITAASDDKMYDGTPLTNDGFTCTDGVLADGDVLTAVVEGTITDAGTAENVVTSYQILRGDVDVTANYTGITTEKGLLSVAKRDVVLTSGDAEKIYDGQSLMNETVQVTGDGFADGEGASYSDFAAITDVGSVDNTFAYTLQNNTKAANYNIQVETGTLTVTPVTKSLVITADDNEKMYDGTPLTDDGFTCTDGVLAKGDVLTAVVEGTVTDAGTAENVVKSYQILRGDADVTANYTGITTEKGLLSVTKRDVTLTSDSASKKYDGTPLTAENVAVAGSGFADGEGAHYSDFASLTHVGQTENTFVYSLHENTKAENYDITVAYGTLSVNRHTDAVLEAGGYTGVYDGQAHEGVTSTAVTGGVEGDEWVYTYSTDGETYTDEMPLFQNVGTYTVWVTAANDDYEGDALTTTVTVEITPAVIVVTADSHTIATGDADPELTYTAQSPVDTETPAFTGRLVRESGAARGSYAIEQGTLALTDGEGFLAANYTLQFVPGTLTILQRAMDVIKTSDKEEVTVGEKITYTITVRNVGEVPLTGIVLTDDMLGVEETIPELAVGESKTFQYVYTTAKADEGKTLVNEVTVTADGGVTVVTRDEGTDVVPVTPETGDQSHLALWTMGVLLSAAGVTILGVSRRKDRRR